MYDQDSSMMSKQLAPDYIFYSYNADHDRTRQKESEIHFNGFVKLDSVRFDHWRSSWINECAVVLHYTTIAWGAINEPAVTQVAGAMAAWRKVSIDWRVVARTEWMIPDEEYFKDTTPHWIK